MAKRVLITGIDGYLGWPLAQHLAARGHEVAGIDAQLRRQWVAEVGGDSAMPIASLNERRTAFREHTGKDLFLVEGDLRDYATVHRLLAEFKPDSIVSLGEMPSAPYSMLDVDHAVFTQSNNIVGTLNTLFAMRDLTPKAHLVKLGTMGEYGTPNIDIPEGFFEIEFRGRKEKLPFPRQPGSFYHLSKVHDSANITLACRIWGLSSTDVMQGVVYGTRIDAMNPKDQRTRTRLDFDHCFGTAINRFVCQALIGEPITPYGKGHQKRGFLPLRDSIQCLTLAVENPPAQGEYRVFNQFEDVYDITQLAEMVQTVGKQAGLKAEIKRLENPRQEREEHYYNPDHKHLLDLGYEPTTDMAAELALMFEDLLPHRERIATRRASLTPDIRWDGTRKKMDYVAADKR